MNNKGNTLFGTDGVRGTFGVFPLDEFSLRCLGRAMGSVLGGSSILSAMDTRFSGPQVLASIAKGMADKCVLRNVGVLPTPGLSFLVARGDWQYGLMITASHNPAADNGVKLFNSMGEKIADELEEAISERFYFFYGQKDAGMERKEAWQSPSGVSATPYLDFLTERAKDIDLGGIRLVLDTANGAMSAMAPKILKKTGAQLTVLSAEPDGNNINRDCGSQYPQSLLQTVLELSANWGIAFDGDGDRVLLVDGQRGAILDGDDILYLLARYQLAFNPLFSRTVVGTVMSNLGLEVALRSLGIELVRAAVGDRHVYHEMTRLKVEIGGEPSGHIIIRDEQKSGDGLLAVLHFFRALNDLRFCADDLARQFVHYPQKMVSIPVSQRPDLNTWPQLQAIEKEFNQSKNNAHARLLIRYSGTEQKIRLMVEADDLEVVDTWIGRLQTFVMETIGVNK